MIEPATLTPRPSIVLLLLGGLVGTLLATALVHLAPAFGFPFVDAPRLIGGVFVADPAGALGLGYALYFLAGVFVVAPALGLSWPSLPGHPLGLGGAVLRGVAWAVALWVLWGLALPLLGALTRLEGPGLDPGLFATSGGALGAVWLLVVQAGYALAAALVAAMGRGIEPLDTLGWQGYGTAYRHVPVRRP
jgi:hypothetical protein